MEETPEKNTFGRRDVLTGLLGLVVVGVAGTAVPNEVARPILEGLAYGERSLNLTRYGGKVWYDPERVPRDLVASIFWRIHESAYPIDERDEVQSIEIHGPLREFGGDATSSIRRCRLFVHEGSDAAGLMNILAHEIGHLLEAELRRRLGLDPSQNETSPEIQQIAQWFGIGEFSDPAVFGWQSDRDDPFASFFAEIAGRVFLSDQGIDDFYGLGLPSLEKQIIFLEWLAVMLDLPREQVDALVGTNPPLQLPDELPSIDRLVYNDRLQDTWRNRGYEVVGEPSDLQRFGLPRLGR